MLVGSREGNDNLILQPSNCINQLLQQLFY